MFRFIFFLYFFSRFFVAVHIWNESLDEVTRCTQKSNVSFRPIVEIIFVYKRHLMWGKLKLIITVALRNTNTLYSSGRAKLYTWVYFIRTDASFYYFRTNDNRKNYHFHSFQKRTDFKWTYSLKLGSLVWTIFIGASTPTETILYNFIHLSRKIILNERVLRSCCTIRGANLHPHQLVTSSYSR